MVQAHTDLLVKIVTRTAKGKDFADLFPTYEALGTFILDNTKVLAGFGLEVSGGFVDNNALFISDENNLRLWFFDRIGNGPNYRIIG